MSKAPSNPWMKFYPADWRADQALRICSLAARGLWIECMCIMHEADPYGHLVINGRPVTEMQLASLTGTSLDQLGALLGELEAAGVFSKNGKGIIFSRRMTRDEKKARNAKKNGKNGGNPTLCKTTENSAPDNPQDKPRLKGEVKAQKPEARVQKEERDRIQQQQPESVAAQGGAAAGPDWMAVGRKVLNLMGIDFRDPTWTGNVGRVKQWLADGADPDLDIFPTVARIMSNRQTPPKSLNYFDGAIADAIAARTKPLPTGDARNDQRRSPANRHSYDRSEAMRRTLAAFPELVGGGERPCGTATAESDAGNDPGGAIEGEWQSVSDPA